MKKIIMLLLCVGACNACLEPKDMAMLHNVCIKPFTAEENAKVHFSKVLTKMDEATLERCLVLVNHLHASMRVKNYAINNREFVWVNKILTTYEEALDGYLLPNDTIIDLKCPDGYECDWITE